MPDDKPESDSAQIPDDLPPVEPPSAGFIIQLFVVPGLIVAAIVGVWLLFGRLAAPDTDWRSQLVELQHPNEHRRWRGALGLAQMLKADQDRASGGEGLTRNPEIAQALADVLSTELEKGSQSEEGYKYQAFLARTLGLFDLPAIVLPPLLDATGAQHDREVRKNALSSIAVLTDRLDSAGAALESAPLVTRLIEVSQDNDPLIRQLAAYCLGLMDHEDARDRLVVLLDDSDRDTRINAAVALARHEDTRGTTVFADVLRRAAEPAEPGSSDEYGRFLGLKNCLLAIERLAPKLTAGDRDTLATMIEPIAESYREPKIRIAAQSALSALRATGRE